MLFNCLKRDKHLPEDLHLDLLVTARLTADEEEEVEDVSGFMATLEALETGPNKKRPLNYWRWRKEKVANKQGGERDDWQKAKLTITLGEAAAMMASDFESLTAHLGRNRELKMVIKEMREEALETDGLAVGHVDWAENMPVKVNIFKITNLT